MKPIIEFISSILLWLLIPLILFVYLLALLLIALGELFSYLFDRADRDRIRLIKKLLTPLQNK